MAIVYAVWVQDYDIDDYDAMKLAYLSRSREDAEAARARCLEQERKRRQRDRKKLYKYEEKMLLDSVRITEVELHG